MFFIFIYLNFFYYYYYYYYKINNNLNSSNFLFTPKLFQKTIITFFNTKALLFISESIILISFLLMLLKRVLNIDY
ncbi:hypothetical protein CW732_03270 [Olleya sp. Bg11-27]|nr:hypothetical protein CW732_03270 [Olleya sp. Bg11-27]